MKFIVCPFCKIRISEAEFPASRRGKQRVVMLCPSCKRRLAFTIRREEEDEKDLLTEEEALEQRITTNATLEVVENRFAFSAQFPLFDGANRVGRYNDKYTPLEVAIRSTDPSMDRIHCTIYAETTPDGELHVFVMDENSLTGTFVNTREVEQGEKCELHHGDVITLGATSILFSHPSSQKNTTR